MNQLIISHRGYFNNVTIIENTIPAFVNNLMDGVEMDVQLTLDDVVVCYHDDSLSRLHHSDFIVTNSVYDDLIPYSINKFSDVLEYFLKHDKKNILIDCEIKVYKVDNNPEYINRICTEISKILKKYDDLNIIITSFNTKVIDIMKTHSIESTMIFNEYSDELLEFLKKYTNTKFIVLNKDIINDKLIDITDNIF